MSSHGSKLRWTKMRAAFGLQPCKCVQRARVIKGGVFMFLYSWCLAKYICFSLICITDTFGSSQGKRSAYLRLALIDSWGSLTLRDLFRERSLETSLNLIRTFGVLSHVSGGPFCCTISPHSLGKPNTRTFPSDSASSQRPSCGQSEGAEQKGAVKGSELLQKITSFSRSFRSFDPLCRQKTYTVRVHQA